MVTFHGGLPWRFGIEAGKGRDLLVILVPAYLWVFLVVAVHIDLWSIICFALKIKSASPVDDHSIDC